MKNKQTNPNNSKSRKNDKLDKDLQKTFGNKELNDFRNTLNDVGQEHQRQRRFSPLLIFILLLIIGFILYLIFQ